MKSIMKNIVKLLSLGLLLGFASCSDSEALIDQVYDSVDSETGVIIRTVDGPQDLVSLNNPANNVIMMTWEVQEGNGAHIPDFKEVRAYVRLYADQDLTEPITADDGSDIAEGLLETFDASTFEISSNGLPRRDVEISTQGIVDLYTNATLTPPTFISLRLEIEMTDGRVYTSTSGIGATVSGGIYFNSPYVYRIIFLPI